MVSGASQTLVASIGCLIVFGLGWGFFDCNNMPILSQIDSSPSQSLWLWDHELSQHQRGGLADWGFGVLRDREVPLQMIFSAFGGDAMISVVLVLLIRPLPKSSR